MKIRHGLMLVGEAGVGKTTSIKTLKYALDEINKINSNKNIILQ